MARRSKWQAQFDTPVHLKFGYEAEMEKRAIRKRLLDEGHPDDFKLHFTVEDEYIKAHANDIPWRERQKVWLAKQKTHTSSYATFTREELDNLIDRYAGANDPVSQSILEKILSMKGDVTPPETS